MRWALETTHTRSHIREDDTVNQRTPTNRFVLWVDAVGGYLVCMNHEVVLGQAVPHTQIEIPILGDLSRQHAKIQRADGDYLIEPLEPTWINRDRIVSRALLTDGVELTLGPSVRFRFRKPHALSATARLEFLSPHRTQPYADGILLMAESCVLGPRTANHVLCRKWDQDVVLYRQEDDLYCRSTESLEIDGRVCDGRGRIRCTTRSLLKMASLVPTMRACWSSWVKSTVPS